MSKTQLQTNNAKLSALVTELQGKAAGEAAITVDTTLTQEGAAADAKVVGNRLSSNALALESLQNEVDEFTVQMIEMVVKIVMRLIQLERNARLQPPVSDDMDTNTEIEDMYDTLFGQT